MVSPIHSPKNFAFTGLGKSAELQSPPSKDKSDAATKHFEGRLETMLSGASDTQRAYLIPHLLNELQIPRANLELYPQLKEMQRQLQDCKESKSTENLSAVSILTADQITSLSKELKSLLARPILNRDSQAFIRTLRRGSAVAGELKKIQTQGPKHVSPMTFVGRQLPFALFDAADCKDGSGLLFNQSTRHVAGKKNDFGSYELARIDENDAQRIAYQKSFADNPAGDVEKIYSIVNGFFDHTLSRFPDLVQKYAEMEARRRGQISDQSSKHEMVEFLKENCGFELGDIKSFEVYQGAFEAALQKQKDPGKIARLRQAATKLAGQDKNTQINYLRRGAVSPETPKYHGLDAFIHNEHLCLPQTKDVEGVYVNLSSSGLAHALAIQDALAAGPFESDQRRLYAYHPSTGLSLVGREEVESLQKVSLAIESNKPGHEILTFIATHKNQFGHSDSLKRLQTALIATGTKDVDVLKSCFELSELPDQLKLGLIHDSRINHNHSLARALLDTLPPSVFKNPDTLVSLISMFGQDQRALSTIKRLIDDHQIDLGQLSSGRQGCVHLAGRDGHVDAFGVLKEWGLDLNQKGFQGQTTAWLAVFDGKTEVIKALARCGADLNLADNDGTAPVHIAATYGDAKLVELLADLGANLNIADGQGQTPAHLAAANGHTNVTQALVQWGADFNIADKQGQTPALLAASFAHNMPIDLSHFKI